MTAKRRDEAIVLEGDPLWYKDAVLYELHVRAFSDSDADGIGDFGGLTTKLDYLQDLGVTALWLLPFYPSPLKDDGYDIADYTGVHSSYGTLADFKVFLREAHRRGLRVVTELVLNHTSDQHPWFQRARRAAPGSALRDYYVWSHTPDRYRDARIIFKDFEASNWTWDPVAGAYYWHRFYSHQPDLNFDSPDVRRQLFQVLDFWLNLGVDGLRLDAIPYLYQREGTNCENLPETHAFLKELRRHVDENFRNRMLLAEANQWPEDAAAYFGNGDECHMAFHFPLMPRMFMSVRMEDRYPIVDILGQTPSLPAPGQWALFLRNHDELTLEMVTDEERDYMYRVYAGDRQMRINLGIRRRMAPLLGSDRRKIELMNMLLLSLPGTPVIYYGDEIGMGDNIYLGDRNGVRTPMQWSPDRNAGFSRASPQRLYSPVVTDPDYHYESVNVEVGQNNPSSLLWWMKRLISLRKRFRAFGRGSIELLYPENRKVLAFVRRYEAETVLVVANLSRFTQYAELDLSAYAGMTPVEVFGQNPFPTIGTSPYFLTLGPHNFFWFALEPQKVEPTAAAEEAVVIEVPAGWEGELSGRFRTAVEERLPAYLRKRRWFGGKAKKLKAVTIRDAVAVSNHRSSFHIAILLAEYVEGDPECYVLPLAVAPGERAILLRREFPQAVVAELRIPDAGAGAKEAVLFDAVYDPALAGVLLDAIARRRRFRGEHGELVASRTRRFRTLAPEGVSLPAAPLKAEQTNTSLLYGDRLILKLFRRPEEGVNPDLEIGRFLTEKAAFSHAPPVAGALEFQRPRGESMTLAILHGYVANQGDAWSYTLDALGRYFERALARRAEMPDPPLPLRHFLELAGEQTPPIVPETIGSYLQSAQLLGTRTAELHAALASGGDDPGFSPEPFSMLYQRSLYQSIRTAAGQTLHLLRRRLQRLPAGVRPDAEAVLAREEEILLRLKTLLERKIEATRIRLHGDYHLGQVLFTGKDFVIVDFEGEPARPLTTRRLKRSPLVDVAGMLRSFHYAARSALLPGPEGGVVRPRDVATLEPWARFWNAWVAAEFLRSYLVRAESERLLPREREQLATLLDALLLEKALYEVSYELQSRPAWVGVPLAGILEILESGRSEGSS